MTSTIWFKIVFACSTVSLAQSMPSILEHSLSVLLAFAAHRTCTYASVAAHEYGHAVTNKLLTGDPINCEINSSFLRVWGRAHYKTALSEGKNVLRTMAGPITGLIATQLQVSMLDYFQALSSKDRIASIKSSLCYTPFSGLMETYNECREASLAPKNFLITTLQTLKIMRCVEMFSDAMYGFLPIALRDGGNTESKSKKTKLYGDGQKLWSYILNKPVGQCPAISNKVLTYAPVALYGLPIFLANVKSNSQRMNYFRNLTIAS